MRCRRFEPGHCHPHHGDAELRLCKIDGDCPAEAAERQPGKDVADLRCDVVRFEVWQAGQRPRPGRAREHRLHLARLGGPGIVLHDRLATAFAQAPALNPARDLVTGVVCGVRVETVEEPLMKEIRILDKLIDELAKGRPMAKVLRS